MGFLNHLFIQCPIDNCRIVSLIIMKFYCNKTKMGQVNNFLFIRYL